MKIINARTQLMTNRQYEVYSFIVENILVNHNFPTTQEIADRFGFSGNNAAHGHIRCLEKKGYIEKIESSKKYRVKNIRLGIHEK